MIFFANFAGFLRELCGQKLLTAKFAKKGREGRKENPPSPPRPGYARGPGRSETRFIIEPAQEERVSRFRNFEGIVDRRFSQRCHDFVPRSIGVQTVLGKVAFEKSFVVDHGAEVIEVDAAGM